MTIGEQLNGFTNMGENRVEERRGREERKAQGESLYLWKLILENNKQEIKQNKNDLGGISAW